MTRCSRFAGFLPTLGVLLIWLLPTPATSQTHFAADPASFFESAANLPAPPKGDVFVLSEEKECTFDAGGSASCSWYLAYRVLTQRGIEQWSGITEFWQPWIETRPLLHARVINDHGTVHNLDPKSISDSPAKEQESNIYSDARVVRAPLPAVSVGSVVEQEIVTNEKNPFPGAGTGFYFPHLWAMPEQHFRLVLRYPESLPLRYRLFLLPNVKPEKTQKDGNVTVTLESGKFETIEAMENLPAEHGIFPRVVVSTGESWNLIARKYGEIAEEKIDLATVRPLVEKITAGKATRDQKAAAIVEYLDTEIRYTGVEFAEAAIIPHAPSETLQHKYGDCKDKSVLVVAMLRAAGIESYVALLNSRPRPDTLPDMPAMSFDHAIVYAPGSPDYWIDATDEYSRLGQLPPPDQGRMALVVRPQTEDLVRTPVSPPQENVMTKEMEVFLAESGPAKVIETNTQTGCMESFLRHFVAMSDRSDFQKSMATYVQNVYASDKLQPIEDSGTKNFSRQFEVKLVALEARRGHSDLSQAAFAINAFALFNDLPDDLTEKQQRGADRAGATESNKVRTAEYDLFSAYAREFQYTIHPPPGFVPMSLPKDGAESFGPATLSQTYSADADGTVHAVLRFELTNRRFSAAQGEAIRNRVVAFKEQPLIMVSFEPRAKTLLAQGKPREAFQLYRSLIAQHPQEALHHLQLANLMLEVGLGEAARREARIATSLEPDSAFAQATLADVLEHDLVGRKFHEGIDYQGAEVAFRAAIRLDPSNHEYIGSLATLLTYAPSGDQFGSGARLQEAITELRKLPPQEAGYLLPIALAVSGDFAAARKAAEVVNRPAIAVVALAEAKARGAAEGIAIIDTYVADSASAQKQDLRNSLLRGAEFVATAGHNYDLASEFAVAAAAGQNASKSMALAQALRRTKLRNPLDLRTDPAGVVTQLISILLQAPYPSPAVDSLLSRNAIRAESLLPATERATLFQNWAEMRAQLATALGPFDAMLDVFLSNLELKPQGDLAFGHRVSVAGLGMNLSMIVVKEDGKFRVLAPHVYNDSVSMGLEILDRLKAGDLKGARALLDWMREDQQLHGRDDPLAGNAFPLLWSKNQAPEASRMRLAAAALLSDCDCAAKLALEVLENTVVEKLNDNEKAGLTIARLDALQYTQDYAGLAAAAQAALQQYPESQYALKARILGLQFSGQSPLAEAELQERLKKSPDDRDLLEMKEFYEARRGDYPAAVAATSQLIASGRNDADDYNNFAWFSLYALPISGAVVENAVKATEMERTSSRLHTLGCVYAEAGQTQQAYKVLLEAMNRKAVSSPEDEFAYAFGRLAEAYGEFDLARSYYAKVTKPTLAYEVTTSPYPLAQIRQERLSQ